jgi:hypothetical protein
MALKSVFDAQKARPVCMILSGVGCSLMRFSGKRASDARCCAWTGSLLAPWYRSF